jgi:hypothetical protein
MRPATSATSASTETTMNNLRIKGIPITLDGREYILPPASLATLEDMAERLDALNAKLSGNGGVPALADFGVATDLVLACLQRNYPDLQRRFVAQHLGLESVADVLDMCYDTSGLLRKSLEARATARGTSAATAAQGGGTLGESPGPASSPTS